MYLSDFSKNAVRAHQARRRIRYLGITPLGYQIWTQEEDELCQQFGSDYATLAQKLPNRSYMAIKKRCQKLGLRRRLRAVTAKELSMMRRLVPRGTSNEIQQAFPHRTLNCIKSICLYHGIYREKKPYQTTGIALIDDIRARCFENNLTMADLDDIARTKRYFQNRGWKDSKAPNYAAVYKAVAALDGEISIRWRGE
ncbi:SANT/Myb-like DNA-binding domain-containing protein [Brucella rhizosphaerae]|uniref:SANT/Myb-like DNA-binding domain-containing protein n=1 Tax=Brucella rhizosphaerae TaxID=571254 RepID=UPI000464830D|nr:SANT/Myb-like DNA-binding domain-containing protein [Brucella rhizosphaerae]